MPGIDNCKVSEDPLLVQELIDLVKDDGAGAISTFLGTTRNVFEDKQVKTLSYEGYVPMAEKMLYQIIAEAREKWSLINCAIHHKIGEVPVGETSVIVVVSSKHRRASLEACHFLIDELKARVPIWKKEIFVDGTAIWKENCHC
ncbi:molybdopterin synthase catalytic subunit-like protein [Basidiobolus meristosporus CBS 931.73]|uniref:Molybdopterin synthase catalytic subunit n=1 Tax=Basidiobolus meristosporus CBS 931.73 TaxID=1314790 RepID=A0A1Y1YKN7_9FUNG|nr:molybdopterin synthase catalytic subunit-like protein [Basidiobolus meristosporus CBS 931.73]|eukprot:ORX98590.1 molybdopterin synthase catalytic subunit-like protein [Basidiobolus meristosporus CBS 931.73]